MCDRAQMLAEGRAEVVQATKAAPPKKKLNLSLPATRKLDEELKHDRRSPEELENATLGKRRARLRKWLLLRLAGSSPALISSICGGVSVSSITDALAAVACGPISHGGFIIRIEDARILNLTVTELQAVASLQGNVWVGSGGPRRPFTATKTSGLAHLR